MKYGLQWKPGGAIPPDLKMKVVLQNEVKPGKAAKPVVKPNCGSCTKITIADLSSAAVLGTDSDTFKTITLAEEVTNFLTTLKVIPVGLDLGVYEQSGIINDPDLTKICWAFTQTAGPTRSPDAVSATALGPNVADGLSLSFNGSTESMKGCSFIVYVRVPYPWLGVGSSSTTVACGQISFSGPPVTPDVVLDSGLDFLYASWDAPSHTGHYGVEPDAEFTIVLRATGYVGLPVTWIVTDLPDGVYQQGSYTTTDDSIYLTLRQLGGSSPDSVQVYWVDPVTSGTSPTVLITQ